MSWEIIVVISFIITLILLAIFLPNRNKIYESDLDPESEVQSGDKAECMGCGNRGYVYGSLIGDKVSAPWCPRCKRNNCLIKIKEK